MWCLMVFNVIALIQSAQGGYRYPKPSIPFELPNQALQNTAAEISKENNIDPKTVVYSLPYDDYQFLEQHKNEESQHTIIEGIDESVQQNIEIGIKQDQSHSLPTPLNANIDVHSAVSQNSAIKESNSISVQPLLSVDCPQLILNIKNKVPPLINLQNGEYIQNVQEDSGVQILDIQNVAHILEANNNKPLIHLHTNQVSSIKEQPNNYFSDIQSLQPVSLQNIQNVIETIESPIINLQEPVPQVLNPENSVQTTSTSGDLNFVGQISSIQDSQILLPNLNDEQIQVLNTQSSQAAVTREFSSQNNHQYIERPVVTKSISFHVPPPDIEETPVISAVPPKKIYKIIFIKVPTYEYQYNQHLQSALYNKLAPVDHKTIIYVLTKKPEIPEQLVLTQPTKVSEHEVLYVQYKGDQTINSEQEVISENISQLPLNSVGDDAIEPRFLDSH